MQVGILITVLLTIAGCGWLPAESHGVINNVTAATHCVAQNWAELVTGRTINEFMLTVDRNAQMLASGVTTWTSVETYANSKPPTTAVYTSSLPATTLGILETTTDMATLWTVLSTGEVFSAEWVATSAKPVGRMYSQQTGLCYEASYSATSGFGTFAESSTGPLGTVCV